MTNEELVTAVELAIDETLSINKYNLQRSRVAAREVIKIVGEAILKHQIGGYPAVSSFDIRSLTQGTKQEG